MQPLYQRLKEIDSDTFEKLAYQILAENSRESADRKLVVSGVMARDGFDCPYAGRSD